MERTIPDKPNSRLQKYRLIEKGKLILGAWTWTALLALTAAQLQTALQAVKQH